MELLGLSERGALRDRSTRPADAALRPARAPAELPILLDLLDEAAGEAGPAVLRRWVRATGPAGGRSTRCWRATSRPSRTRSASSPSAGSCSRAGRGRWARRSSTPLRVRYGECDLQGVVFNAHYLAYFDIGMTELWRAALGGYQAMIDRGLDMVVVEAQLHFLGRRASTTS